MAGFSFNGIDSISASFAELAEMDDETREKLLRAGGEAIERHQKEYLQQHHSRTGELAGAITLEVHPKSALVVPRGKQKRVKHRVKSQTHKESGGTRRSKHHGKTRASSMMDVGYYLEFGTPRMAARHWMENSNKEAEPDFDAAMAAAWNEHLNKIGF